MACFPPSEKTQKLIDGSVRVTQELLLDTFKGSVSEAINLALYAAEPEVISNFSETYRLRCIEETSYLPDSPSDEILNFFVDGYKIEASRDLLKSIAEAKTYAGSAFINAGETPSEELVLQMKNYADLSQESYRSMEYPDDLIGVAVNAINKEISTHCSLIKFMQATIVSHTREAITDNIEIEKSLEGWMSVLKLSRYRMLPPFAPAAADLRVIENYVIDNQQYLANSGALLTFVMTILRKGDDSRTIEVAERIIANVDQLGEDQHSIPKALGLYLHIGQAALNANPEIQVRALSTMDIYFDKFIASEEGRLSIKRMMGDSTFGEVVPDSITSFIGKPEHAAATPGMVYEVLRRINKIGQNTSDADPSGVLTLMGDEKVAAKALSHYISKNPDGLMKVRDSIVNTWQMGVVNLVAPDPAKSVRQSPDDECSL